jgi:hypothetical protein
MRGVQVGTSTNPALIVAAMQLDLVQLLRAAMNGGVDPGGPHVGPIGGIGTGGGEACCGPCGPCDTFEKACSRPVLCPEPRYLPRPVIRPTPYYAPVPWPTRLNPGMPKSWGNQECAEAPSIEQAPQPPWKVLPWQEPAKIPPKIKVVIQQPDILRRGTLIDFFC